MNGGNTFEVLGMSHSVIVDDLDPFRVAVLPDKTDAVLGVDSNAVLSSSFAFQRL